MKIRNVNRDDLTAIIEIENKGFNELEAGTKEQYEDRIKNFRESFFVAVNDDDQIIGFICGPAVKEQFIEDWMYEKNPKSVSRGGYQTVQTIAVSPDARGLGIGSLLLLELENHAKSDERIAMSLTCLIDRIPFYEKNGYKNMGISKSNHADEQWFNMEKLINQF